MRRPLACYLTLLFGFPLLAHTAELSEPDTGLVTDHWVKGQAPDLAEIFNLHDIEAAARNTLNVSAWSYYRTGADDEFTFHLNHNRFHDVRLRPRVLRNVLNVSLETTILGYNFSLPVFIAPAARAGLANPVGELGLVEAAGKAGILYTPSLSASKRLEDIAAAALPGQNLFHQLYVSYNRTKLINDVRRIESSGYKAIIVTVDNPIHGTRTRETRYGWPETTDHDAAFDWGYLAYLRNLTSLPVIPKGIQTVEDALLAAEAGVPAIYVSNHGGRQLDTSPTTVEILLEIRRHAPQLFDQIEIYADGGVRHGTDILKLLALGAKAVGVGRPAMYANIWGEPGVSKMISLLRKELLVNTAVLGVTKPSDLNPSYLNTKKLDALIYDL